LEEIEHGGETRNGRFDGDEARRKKRFVDETGVCEDSIFVALVE
jgi:hypothetical protein